MKNIEEIAKKYYEKFKDKEYVFTKGYDCLKADYLYDKVNNIIVGLLLKKNKYDNNAFLLNIYIFDNQKNIYSFDGETFKQDNDDYSILYFSFIKKSCEKELIQNFKKLFGHIVFLKVNEPIYFDSIEMITKFYKFKELKKAKGKIQNKIDELINYPLKTYAIKDFTARTNFYLSGTWYVGAKSSCKIEMINNNTFVIRMFILCKKPYEVFRIYVEENKIYKCRKTNIGYWVSAKSISNDYYNFNFDKNDITDEFKNTKLWYIRDILKDFNDTNTIKLAIMFLEDNILEQLYKFGFDIIFKKRIHDMICYGTDGFINHLFGYYNKKGKNLFQKVGLNKHQLTTFCDYINNANKNFWDFVHKFFIIRYIYGEDISSLDSESFDRMMKFIFNANMQNPVYSSNYLIDIVNEMKELGKTNHCIISILENFINKRINNSSIHTFRDVLIMMKELNNPNFDLNFNNWLDILDKHTILTELCNSNNDNENIMLFDSRKKIWENWTFENEKFVIKYPSDTNEIANEGIKLRHCVKSYIKSVIKGNTNILFLRKKESINEPYFTIEISNDGVVRQIHGYCNSNVRKNSEEYSFLVEWSKQNKCDIKDINKVLACG
jgi:hypothetical protein